MFVLMRFGNKLKNGRPIWQEKISPLEPPNLPLWNSENPALMFKRVEKHDHCQPITDHNQCCYKYICISNPIIWLF